MSGDLRLKEAQLSQLSSDLLMNETLLSSFVEMAAEQSKHLAVLGASMHDTIPWDSTCKRSAAVSSLEDGWSEVVVRNRINSTALSESTLPPINLANRFSMLELPDSQDDLSEDAAVAATSPRLFSSPAPGADSGLLSTVEEDRALGSPAALEGGEAVKADPAAPVSVRPLARRKARSLGSSARRRLLRVAVSKRSRDLPTYAGGSPGLSQHARRPPASSDVKSPSSRVVSGESTGPRSPLDSPRSPPSPTTVILGDSIVRNVAFRNARTVCLPGATVASLTDMVRDVTLSFPDADQLVIHVGSNDVARQQSELLKRDFIGLFEVLDSLHYRIYISGPTPVCGYGDGRYSRLRSLNTWLESVCSAHQFLFIDNFNLLWKRKNLFAWDGLHLNAAGAMELSSNLSYWINHRSAPRARVSLGTQTTVSLSSSVGPEAGKHQS